MARPPEAKMKSGSGRRCSGQERGHDAERRAQRTGQQRAGDAAHGAACRGRRAQGAGAPRAGRDDVEARPGREGED